MTLKASVLRPPSNVERTVGLLQEEIFSRSGLVSSLVLPVCMPICWHPESVSGSDFRSALEGCEHRFTLMSAGLQVHSDTLFFKLDLDAGGDCTLSKLKKKLIALNTSAAETLFPIFNGFFLAQSTADVRVGRIAGFLSEPKPLRFSAFTYALLHLSVSDPPDPWYEEVYWKFENQTRVKKKPASNDH